MPTIRHVHTVDLATPNRTDQIYPVEFSLEPMQFAIVTVGATARTVERRLVVAKVNQLGGVCDDCPSFDPIAVVRAEIYQVLINP